jgi:hypothetical protein
VIEVVTLRNVSNLGVHLGIMDEARLNLQNTLLQAFTMVEFKTLPVARFQGPVAGDIGDVRTMH